VTRTGWLRPVIALVCGLVLTLAFPPYGLWPLAVAAVAGLVLVVRGVTVPGGALLGLLFGLGFFVPLLRWTGEGLGPAPWLLLAVFEALYFLPLGAALTLVQRLPGWPLWAALVWVAVEALRARFPFEGFTWGRLAFSQADAPTLGLARVGGASLVSLAVALAGAVLAWAVVAWRAESRVVAGIAVLFSGGILLTGLAVPQPATTGATATIAVVQGNVPRLGFDFAAQREAVLRNHVRATVALAERVQAGQAEQPALVIWPENASDIDPFQDPAAAQLIDGAARAIGVPILVGAVVDTNNGANIENTAIVWHPETGPGDTYVKRHPVPFAEYVPFRGLARMVVPEVDELRPRDMVKGDDVGVLRVGPARVGTVICFEVAYDDVVRDAVREGGQLIAVLTNNATFGFTPQTEQQLVMSRLRAVEHGRTVLVTATSGVSAVIDTDGSVRQRAEIFTAKTFVEPVVLSDHTTIATRAGEWPELIASVLAVLAVVIALRWGRRGARTPTRAGPAGLEQPRGGRPAKDRVTP
jgi:apolipoprotein N-acyltransferase